MTYRVTVTDDDGEDTTYRFTEKGIAMMRAMLRDPASRAVALKVAPNPDPESLLGRLLAETEADHGR